MNLIKQIIEENESLHEMEKHNTTPLTIPREYIMNNAAPTNFV
jgi:hypothetical protein